MWNIDLHLLVELVPKCESNSEVVKSLGLPVNKNSMRAVYRRIKKLSLDCSHFKVKPRRHHKYNKYSLEEILVENSFYKSTRYLKKRLIREGWFENKCHKCGQLPEWEGQTLIMVLDHKNGVPNDHRIENLWLLCPNCNSQTDTFAGRNAGNPLARAASNIAPPYPPPEPRVRSKRREKKVCPPESRVRSKRREKKVCLLESCTNKVKRSRNNYCSIACLSISGSSHKTKHPSAEQLQEDLNSMSWLAIGRKYGVSDNAVRKWAKALNVLPPENHAKIVFQNKSEKEKEDILNNLSNRSLVLKGSSVASSKLTEDKVREILIKHRDGAKYKELAAEYGVDVSNIGLICRRKAWKHVTIDD